MAFTPVWPAVNAALNAMSAVLLVAGFFYIRQRRIAVHRAFMAAAFATSTLFLLSYLGYHYSVGATRFQGQGWPRTIYLSILLSHTVLAVIILPMAITTLYRALRGQFDRHRGIARWTLPLWIYVSVTGVVIYAMLYHLYPSR